MAEARDKGGGRTWAAMVGDSLSPSLNKNVLEIVLEKETRGGFSVSELDCARVLRKLKLDSRPGDIEQIQICPNGRGVILITLKSEVNIEHLCGFDQFVVTESGIRVVMIKPSGKREVMVNMKGLHPNTSDKVVIDYLCKFGKIASTRVSYGSFGDGPLKGIKNGDRSYRVELKAGSNIPTYHVIDGNRVTVRYTGQQQTCARCHQVPGQCRGKGVARKCEAEGGEKVEFLDYIYDLWARIGHNPSEPVVEDGLALGHDQETDSGPQVSQHGAGGGVSVKAGQDPTLFTGVSIRSFDKDQDQGNIVDFLLTSGLKEEYKDHIKFSSKGEVTITEVDSDHCQALITAIHLKKAPGESEESRRTLKCNGIVPYTPPKPKKPPNSSSPAFNPNLKNENPVDLSNKPVEKIPNLQHSSGEEFSDSDGDVEGIKNKTVNSRKHKMTPEKEEESKKVDTKTTPEK